MMRTEEIGDINEKKKKKKRLNSGKYNLFKGNEHLV